MNPYFHVVDPGSTPTAAESIRHAIDEIRAAGARLSYDLVERTEALARDADEIAGLGEAVPVGVREEARRLAETLGDAALRMQAIMGRVGR